MNKFLKAFTLAEVMVALIVVSLMLAALAPVMTAAAKHSKSDNVQIQKIIDSTPVGVVVVWIGTNYPEDWIPLNGQSIMEPEYVELRQALGGIEALPNMNEGADPNSGSSWIIKAVAKR